MYIYFQFTESDKLILYIYWDLKHEKKKIISASLSIVCYHELKINSYASLKEYWNNIFKNSHDIVWIYSGSLYIAMNLLWISAVITNISTNNIIWITRATGGFIQLFAMLTPSRSKLFYSADMRIF